MKDLNLLIWLTQLGFNVAAPLVGFTLLAVWLREARGWGVWVIWAGVLLGSVLAIDGFRSSIKMITRLSRNNKSKESPPISFNEHD